MKIALIRPGSLGDIVMICSLVTPLRRYHDVTLFVDPRMFTVLGDWIRKNSIVDLQVLSAYDPSRFDKTINLIGYPIDQGHPFKPMDKHVMEYWAKEMDVPFTFDGLRIKIPPAPRGLVFPYLTLQNKTGWSAYKEWPQENWNQLAARLRTNYNLYQLGGPSDPRIEGTQGEFMKLPFEEQVAVQSWASAHIGLDSVFNHTANVLWEDNGRTPTVILWGSSQPTGTGYPHGNNICLGLPCSPCFREDPKVSSIPLGPCINPPNQTYDKPKHACMAGITPEMVYKTIERVLNDTSDS